MNRDICTKLEQVESAWRVIGNVPEDLSQLGFPGMTKTYIAHSLGGLVEMANELAEIATFEPDLIEQYSTNQHVTNIQAYVTQHIPNNPQPHLPGFFAIIDQIRQVLERWIDKADQGGKKTTPRLTQRLADSLARIRDAATIYDSLVVSQAAVSKAVLEIETKSAAISEAVTSVAAGKAVVENDSKKITESVVTATADSITIKELVEKLEGLRKDLEGDKKRQDEIFEEFEKNKVAIDVLLGDANRTGMAASFRTRMTQLETPVNLWVFIFVCSIFSLLLLAQSYLSSIGSANWQEAVIRLPISGALIWLGWFAAKQYGYTRQLQEDYAYKVASAMSFEGYKREAGSIDPELLKRLMDTAISSLSENPVRIYEKYSNHASPATEFFEKVLKDDSLVAALKSFLQRK